MRSIVFALLVSYWLLGDSTSAAQPAIGDFAITVGDSIKEVKKSLEGHGVAFSQDSLAIDATEQYLTFEIDPQQSFAIVSFKEGTKKVSTVELVVHPPNQPQKSFRTLLNLRSLTLHEGGDYTVRVAKD